MSRRPVDARLEEYWDWFAVALFVLVTLDLLTTLAAAAHVGPAAEANPLVRWALGRGLLALVAVNLVATLAAGGGFALLMRLVERAAPPDDRYLGLGVEVWLGGLIAGGLIVFANDLAVIVHGRSLLLLG